MNLQSLVPKLLAGIVEDRRQRAAAERHAKEKLVRGATNLRLLCDKLRDMGVDPETQTGRLVLARVLKIAAIQKEMALDDVEMPPSEIGGDW
jgi:hypothetical protein